MKIILALIAIGIILYVISLYSKKKKVVQRNNLKQSSIKNSKVTQYSSSYKKNSKTIKSNSIKPSEFNRTKVKTETPVYPTEVSFNSTDLKYTMADEDLNTTPSKLDSYTGSNGSFSGSGAGSRYDDDSYRSSYTPSSYSSSYDSSSGSDNSSSHSSSSSSSSSD